MRSSLRLACLLLLAPLPARAADLSGIWYTEYRDGQELIQEVSQRLEGGRWRAELRIYQACRQTERFMLEGRWELADQALTHVIQRRGNRFTSPQRMRFEVLALEEDSTRLRTGWGALIEARRVSREFQPRPPDCAAG